MRMKQIGLLITFMIIACVTSLAQETEVQDRKMSYGLSIYPNYSKLIFTSTKDTNPDVLEIFKDRISYKPSLSLTAIGEYSFSKFSSIGLGLGLHNYGYTSFMQGSPTDPNIFPDHTTTSNYYNIEIPLYYKFKFSSRLYTQIGISTLFNISLDRKTEFNYPDGIQYYQDTQKLKFDRTHILGNLGLGYNYYQGKRLDLFIQSYFQTNIIPNLNELQTFNTRLFSAGLATGFRF